MTNEDAIKVFREWSICDADWEEMQEAIYIANAALKRDRWISSEEPPDNPRDVLVTAYYHERWQTLIGWYDVKWHVAAYDNVSAITYCTGMKVCMEHGYETIEEILSLNAKNTSPYLVEVQDDKTGVL